MIKSDINTTGWTQEQINLIDAALCAINYAQQLAGKPVVLDSKGVLAVDAVDNGIPQSVILDKINQIITLASISPPIDPRIASIKAKTRMTDDEINYLRGQ